MDATIGQASTASREALAAESHPDVATAKATAPTLLSDENLAQRMQAEEYAETALEPLDNSVGSGESQQGATPDNRAATNV